VPADRQRSWFGVWLACATLSVVALPARADDRILHVKLAEGACPEPDALQDEIESLLEADVEVGDELQREPDVVVSDLGDRYAVEIGSQRRLYLDPARDCKERARVVAVFVALNAKPTAAAASAASAREPPLAAAPLRVGMEAAATGAYAAERASPGAALGLWLELGSLRLAFDFGAALAQPVTLARDDGRGLGSVDLIRVPLTWTASYLFELGAFAFGPALGVGLDLLHLRGNAPLRAQSGLRANLGGVGAVDARVRLSSNLAVMLRFGLSVFPRVYELAVEPVGSGGETPRRWWGAQLAIAWRFAG
jgi:hypothetical protein